MTGNRRIHKHTRSGIVGAGLALTLAVIGMVSLDPEQRIVAFPIYAIFAVTAALIAVLWKRDKSPPYFDLGVFCVIVTALYLCYPLFAFLLSGLVWTELSDNRLATYNPTPFEFSRVAWWGVLYLFSLALTYATVRKYPAASFAVKLEPPRKSVIIAIVLLYVSILLYTQIVQFVFGVDLNPTYGSEGATVANLPLLFQQVTGKVIGIGFVLQCGLILLLVGRANVPVWRWTLRAWAISQVIMVIIILGGRSAAVFFLVAWLLAHQRVRPPLRPLSVLMLSTAIVLGALLYGFVRGIGQTDTIQSALSAGNEFQGMYGTAYNLMSLRDNGELPNIPWVMYFADILRLLPQQLLPFDKIDPSDWYLELIGVRGTGVGLMFGVISEAAIGLGAIEMVLRGAILGFLLGEIHNWYSRNASGFWPTMFYLWLCIWSYYTYRASTFYLLGHVVFMFLPAYILVRVVSSLVDGARLQPPFHMNTKGA